MDTKSEKESQGWKGQEQQEEGPLSRRIAPGLLQTASRKRGRQLGISAGQHGWEQRMKKQRDRSEEQQEGKATGTRSCI